MPHKDRRVAADRVLAPVPVHRSGWFARLRRISIWVAALALVYSFSLLRDLPVWVNQIDFSHYYVSALAMRQGVDPYTTDLKPLAVSLGLDIAEMNHATYPPTFVLLFEPLTLLSPLAAYGLWFAMNIGFLATALYLLFDGLPGDTDLRLALLGLAILYPPITYNFEYAQTQILILLLLILFMRCLDSGRQALAGFMLALAALLKVFPAILIAYLLLRRQGKAVVYTGIGLIFGGVVTLALVGVERSLHFLQVLPFLTSPYFLSRASNVALDALVSRLFWIGSGDPGMEFTRRAAVVAVELVLLALTVRATLRSSTLSDNGDDRVIALWVTTAVLLSPTAWIHYLVLLLIPFAVLLRQALRGEASPRATQLGLTSYMVAEALMVGLAAVSFEFGELPNWALLSAMIGWSLSLLLAYAAAYSLAVDAVPTPVTATSRTSRGGPYRR